MKNRNSVLDKIQIRRTAISGRIVLARFGKDPTLALEQRDAQSEFFQAICDFAFDSEMPEPGEEAEVEFGAGDEQFVMTVKRKERPS